MNNVIKNRIIELYGEGDSGYLKIARILQHEFPNEGITLKGWQSRVMRTVYKEQSNKLDVIKSNINNESIVKQVIDCNNLTSIIEEGSKK